MTNLHPKDSASPRFLEKVWETRNVRTMNLMFLWKMWLHMHFLALYSAIIYKFWKLCVVCATKRRQSIKNPVRVGGEKLSRRGITLLTYRCLVSCPLWLFQCVKYSKSTRENCIQYSLPFLQATSLHRHSIIHSLIHSFLPSFISWFLHSFLPSFIPTLKTHEPAWCLFLKALLRGLVWRCVNLKWLKVRQNMDSQSPEN